MSGNKGKHWHHKSVRKTASAYSLLTHRKLLMCLTRDQRAGTTGICAWEPGSTGQRDEPQPTCCVTLGKSSACPLPHSKMVTLASIGVVERIA